MQSGDASDVAERIRIFIRDLNDNSGSFEGIVTEYLDGKNIEQARIERILNLVEEELRQRLILAGSKMKGNWK